jgi:predicted membrane-bound mannosyltransferase
VKYADGDVALVYVSGVDSYKVLVGRVENLSRTMNGTDTEIAVIADDYWPLPWSMRDYGHAAWWGKSMPDQTAPIIISSKSDFSEIKEDLRGNYAGPEKYDLRPGATVYLYYKRQ